MKKLILIVITFGIVNLWAQATLLPNSTALPQMIPPQSAADLNITSRVNQQIFAKMQQNFMQDNYNIYTQNGEVTIQGRAKTQEEANDILAAARATPGVRTVVNGIVVNPQY